MDFFVIYFKYFCIMHIYNAIRNKQGNEFAIVHTFQESIKINIITSNPLQFNIHSHHFHDVKKKKKPIPLSPHPH